MAKSIVESPTEAVLNVAKTERIRVLHVDDDQTFLKVAKQCLEMQGPFQVDMASYVEEAMEKMKKEAYDGVVSDYQMPGKDGLEFLKELREKGNTVPFIVFTGKGREETVVKALNLGADQYVDKHGDPETVYRELAHSIRRAVKGKHDEEQLLYQAQLMQQVNDAIIASDENFIMTSWNQAAERTYGWKANEVIGRLGQDVLQSEFVGIDRAQAIQMLRETGKFSGEVVQLHRNGHRINVETNAMVLRGENNQIIGYVSVNRDIAERKKAEEALRESEIKFRSIFESTGDGLISLDFSGRILDANGEALRIFGGSKEEVLGKHFTEFGVFSLKDMPTMMKGFSDVLRGKHAIPKVTIRNKNGQMISLECSASLLKVNGKSTITVVAEDVSERKIAEEALKESEARFHCLVEDAFVSIAITDTKGQLTYVNQATADMLGYSKSEMIGQPFASFLYPGDKGKIMRLFLKSMILRMRPQVIEYRLVHKDGHILNMRAKPTKLTVEGKSVGFQAISVDITERKKTEEELIKNT